MNVQFSDKNFVTIFCGIELLIANYTPSNMSPVLKL